MQFEKYSNIFCILRPFRERRKILENNIKILPNSSVRLSECHFLKTKNELSIMTAKVYTFLYNFIYLYICFLGAQSQFGGCGIKNTA